MNNINKLYRICFLVCLLTNVLWIQTVSAQVSVEARIDSVEIFIGQQTGVTVTVKCPSSASVQYPNYPEGMVTPGVEVVRSSEVAKEDNGTEAIYNKVYTLTSFEDSLYQLPPFAVKVDGKEYASRKLALKVITVDVDTTKLDQFFGPMDVQDNPFLWEEWVPMLVFSIAEVVFLLILIYLIICLLANKPVIATIKFIKRLPAHQKAINAINEIKAEGMVREDDLKDYYTRLTDAIRKYIEERYHFNAMEKTSSEIIEELAKNNDQKAIQELRQLFTTADLVKFAKHKTMLNENDSNLLSAIEFINETKSEDDKEEMVAVNSLTEEDKQKKKTRKWLKITIAAISVLISVLLAMVIVSIP